MENLQKFETDRLILKQVTDDDFSHWQKNFVDYEVIRNLSSLVPWPYPENGVESFYKTTILPSLGINRWLWGIFLKDNPGELIGCVDLWREGKPENRGFWLAHKHWGKGLMSEAVTPITEYAYTELGFEKLIFSNAEGNIKSRRIKEKAGAKLLRIEPANFVDPKFTHHEVWELTKENWKKFNHK